MRNKNTQREFSYFYYIFDAHIIATCNDIYNGDFEIT